MFFVDDNGKARKLRSVNDIEDLAKCDLKVIEDDGQVMFRKISKETLHHKMFGR